jgi:hypothetical protein
MFDFAFQIEIRNCLTNYKKKTFKLILSVAWYFQNEFIFISFISRFEIFIKFKMRKYYYFFFIFEQNPQK